MWFCPGYYWRQPRRGCRGHIPSNVLVGGTSMGISPPILLRTFGYSRPILVVLAQWQHLMVSFIHCFARKSKSCHRIDQNPTEGAHDKEKLWILHLRIHRNTPFLDHKTKKLPPPRLLPWWGGGVAPVKGNTPSTTHPLRRFVPQLWTRVDATAGYA